MSTLSPPYVPQGPGAQRPVHLAAWSLFCPAGIGTEGLTGGSPGKVPSFRARSWVADRKSLKLMGRAVQLGVSAVKAALDGVDDWSAVPPERRALFVGASPQLGDPGDLAPALAKSTGDDGFDLQRFAEQGISLIHPLWLVRGLSNNVIGFASAFHDLQGVNSNYCDGSLGGWTAITEAHAAVAEGRADLAIAGGADAFVGGEDILGTPCGEGAAFVVFRAARPGEATVTLGSAPDIADTEAVLGHLGAAAPPIAWIRARFGGHTQP